jgi:hypothetical protein
METGLAPIDAFGGLTTQLTPIGSLPAQENKPTPVKPDSLEASSE